MKWTLLCLLLTGCAAAQGGYLAWTALAITVPAYRALVSDSASDTSQANEACRLARSAVVDHRERVSRIYENTSLLSRSSFFENIFHLVRSTTSSSLTAEVCLAPPYPPRYWTDAPTQRSASAAALTAIRRRPSLGGVRTRVLHLQSAIR